jgi:GWxTD domain-containing protein
MFFKKILKAFLFLPVFLLMVYRVNAQDEFFYLDYGLYKGLENKTIIEIYYSFDQRQLKFIKSANGYDASGKIDLIIHNRATGKAVINESFNVPVAINDTAGYNKNNRLVGQLNLQLDSGNYSINVAASDFNNESLKFIDTVSFRLVRFPEDKVLSSSIQLATNIYKSEDKNSIFYKNNLEVEPNPSRLFGNNIARLFYYIEFYNLTDDLLSEDYYVNSAILSSDNKVISENKKSYKRSYDSKVEIGSFDIRELISGKYNLKITLADNKNTMVDISKPFYIYNTGITDNTQQFDNNDNDYLLSDISKMTKDELMNEYEKSRYVISDNFKEKFESLNDLESQKKYYYSFWKSLDPTPETPVNEFKKDYFEKVQYANKYLKSDTRKGWETDRGRVYIQLGKPSEIERFPFEADTKAYEIWRYDNIEGGVEFVFIDISNDGGTYELVHSTKKNELRNDEWKRRLAVIK